MGWLRRKHSRVLAMMIWSALSMIALAACSSPVTPTPTTTPVPTIAPTPTVVVASATSGKFDINIVEPALKSPFTWNYDPANLVVKLGIRLDWTNKGAVLHTVTSDDGTFESGDMAADASFSFTPPSDGTFPYHCKYHPWMKGTLVVQK